MMEMIEENIKLVNRIETLENVFIKHEVRRNEDFNDLNLNEFTENYNLTNLNGIYNNSNNNSNINSNSNSIKNQNNKENEHDSKIVSENNILRTRINKLEKELI